jgi:hypothetical protein
MQTYTGPSFFYLHGLLISRRDGDRVVQPVRALRANTVPQRNRGTSCRTAQQKFECGAISRAIHAISKLHTDVPWGAEGPASQSDRLSCLREFLCLKIDIVLPWRKEGNQ